LGFGGGWVFGGDGSAGFVEDDVADGELLEAVDAADVAAGDGEAVDELAGPFEVDGVLGEGV